MNIESANLSSLPASSAGTVDNMPQSSAGSVIAEGFSGALVAQIDLLSNIKAADSLPLQLSDNAGSPISNGSQGVAALPAGKVDMQNIAALLGSDLPSAYKINSDIDHKDVLAAVTDTLKYIGMSTTAAEKAAVVEQNIKDVIAMAIPFGQTGKAAMAAAVPVGQANKAAAAVAVGQNVKDAMAVAVPVGQTNKAAVTVAVGQSVRDAMAVAVPVGQTNKAAAAVAVGQTGKDATVAAVPVGHANKDAATVAVGQNVRAAMAAAVPVGQTNKAAAAVAVGQNVRAAMATAVPVGQANKAAATVAVGQNVRAAMAAAVPVGQANKAAAAVAVGQNVRAAMAAAVPVGQANKAAAAVAVGQNVRDAMAAAVPVGQTNKAAVTVAVGQNVRDAMTAAAPSGQTGKDVIAAAVPEGKNLKNALAMAAQAGRNSKDAIAASVPVRENIKDAIATAAPAEGNIKDAFAMTVSVNKPDIKDAITTAAPTEQSRKEAAATVVQSGQNIKATLAMAATPRQAPADVAAEAEQGMKEAMVSIVTAQIDLKPAKNDKPDKKQREGETPIAVVEDNHPTEGLTAAVVIPTVMPTEQEKTANNLASADMIEEGELLSFIKSSTEDTKSNQSGKAPEDALRNTTVFRQPVQDNQNFNLKSFDNIGNTGPAEKAGRAEQSAFSVEGEKTLSRVGTDLVQPSKLPVDNKVDVPAITKPLSHPEWNKDLGERIVWMSSKAIPTAEIRLNPQHLGPISVRVDVADDQATVVFTAQHAATREAIEASLPKLREMMGTQQLNLTDVTISQGSMSDQGRSQAQNFAQTADGRGQGAAANVAGNGVDEIEQEIESGRAVVSNGLLSIYA